MICTQTPILSREQHKVKYIPPVTSTRIRNADRKACKMYVDFNHYPLFLSIKKRGVVFNWQRRQAHIVPALPPAHVSSLLVKEIALALFWQVVMFFVLFLRESAANPTICRTDSSFKSSNHLDIQVYHRRKSFFSLFGLGVGGRLPALAPPMYTHAYAIHVITELIFIRPVQQTPDPFR